MGTLVDCVDCGGDNPPTGTVGHGWIEVESDPVLPVEGAAERHPPQITVKPCPRCESERHRRWRIGHLPCHRGTRGAPCSECKRIMGVAAPEEDEHLPGDDTRYATDEDTREFAVPAYEQDEFLP